MAAEFVVSHQHAKWASAQCSVLLFVDLLEGLALVEFDGFIQVLEQIVLADVQQLDFEAARSLGLHHEILQATPRTFQFLESFGMHDFVQLPGNERVQLRDARVDHHLGVFGDGPFAGHYVPYQIL